MHSKEQVVVGWNYRILFEFRIFLKLTLYKKNTSMYLFSLKILKIINYIYIYNQFKLNILI